ncbi:hypothetical protein GOP88_12605 [Vibrio cholerae]|nr:hypothetical protein [Vibrio cholerae]MEB5549574.1 hypothetical protein [Vibrio cholerae]
MTYIKPSLSLGLIVKITLCVAQQARYTKALKIFTFQPDSVTPTLITKSRFFQLEFCELCFIIFANEIRQYI